METHEIGIDYDIESLLKPTEFSKCTILLKSEFDPGKLENLLGAGYFLEKETDIILGLGTTTQAQSLDSALLQLKVGQSTRYEIKDEHNISHHFDVTLVRYDEATQIHDTTCHKRLERATTLKNAGTTAFQRKDIKAAFHLFSRAIKYLICIIVDLKLKEINNPQLKRDVDSLKCTCHLNLAACQLLGANTEGAIKNCSVALTIEPHNIKGLFRRGHAHIKLKDYHSAIEDLRKATEMDPDNKPVFKLLEEAKKLMKKEEERLASNLKGMFS